jgi:hypothetical protein
MRSSQTQPLLLVNVIYLRRLTDSNTILLTWKPEFGAAYQIQSRKALTHGDWQNIGDRTLGTNASCSLSISNDGSASVFFRAVQVPQQ